MNLRLYDKGLTEYAKHTNFEPFGWEIDKRFQQQLTKGN